MGSSTDDFVHFASGITIMDPNGFTKAVRELSSLLLKQANDLTEQFRSNPTQELSDKALAATERFMAFNEILRIGSYLTASAIDSMKRDALLDPDDATSRRIISLANEIDGVNGRHGDVDN